MVIAKGRVVADTVLWVEDTGEANLPPVLCLHSLFVDGGMFRNLVEKAEGKYRVICPDFRAQGSSAPATDKIVTMDQCADDMLALIEIMQLPQVHIAAASMGGDVSVRMAAKRPDLVKSMVMMGSSVRAEPPIQKTEFTNLLDRTFRTGFVGDDLELLMAIMFGAATRERSDMQEALDYWRTKMRLLGPSVWAAMYGVVARENASSLLGKIRVPTLVINGKDDIARPPEWAREVVDGIKGSELLLMEKVGHSPILEAPDIVIPSIFEFFDRVEVNAGRKQKKSFLQGLFS